jgi:hypothetical protein
MFNRAAFSPAIRLACWGLSLRIRGLTSPLTDREAEADEMFRRLDRRLDPTHRAYGWVQDEILYDWLADRPPIVRKMTLEELYGALREFDRREGLVPEDT